MNLFGGWRFNRPKAVIGKILSANKLANKCSSSSVDSLAFIVARLKC